MRTLMNNAVLVLALGSWGGIILFYAFMVTPALFATLGRDDGGRAVNVLFPGYFQTLVVATLAVALLAGLRAWSTGAGCPVMTVAGLALVAAGVAAYSRWGFLPLIHQAERGTPAFTQLHLISLGLNFVVLALFVVSALLVARFPADFLGTAGSGDAVVGGASGTSLVESHERA